jgi:hypothetical protein
LGQVSAEEKYHKMFLLHNQKIMKIMKKYTDYLARRKNLEEEG